MLWEQTWPPLAGSASSGSQQHLFDHLVSAGQNCQSLLTGTPEVTVLDGPPGVSASVTEAMVLPRLQQCARPVKGAKLRLIADKIEDQSYSIATLRIKYKTKDGERARSLTFSLSLFP